SPPPRSSPPRNSGVITSAQPPVAAPAAPAAAAAPQPHQPPVRARRASPVPPEAVAPPAAVPATSISESVSREIELRGRPKPSTVEIGDILEELDAVTASPPGSHAAELEVDPTRDPSLPPTDAAPARRDRAATEREPEMATGDRDALRELFNELAGHHLAQLRDLMIEVRLGSALSEWIELSEPAVRSVRGMAEQLEMTELCGALDKLLVELTGARQKGGAISGARRDALLAAYAPLQELVPGALEVDKERDRREPVIVHSLLRQVEGVEKVAIDRLVAAQLVSIAALSTARPDELAAVTGLSRDLAERLIARFRDYRAQSGVVASPDPMAELRFLGVLCASLRQQNRDYDDAGAQWSDDAKERKRLLRRERAETLLRIHVSLARLGQVDQLVELDKLSFRRKADFVEAYLKAARATRAKTALPGQPT
ncbi:MAG TPA: helix-hairpin-helix domain-containing protein, partial [Kofleriaceae bacterium]|nr:helix-hairpin-helix domain-containing protein [Kofleriaceae bacterium]